MSIFTANIRQQAIENSFFRKVLFTTPNKDSQLVLMSLQPGEDIGQEVHEVDQILSFVSGSGVAVLDGKEYPISPDSIFCVPAGVTHNFINSGDGEMKLYTVYAPAHHKDQIVHKTKQDAVKSEESGEDEV